MDDPLRPSGALPLLAELFRSRRSGLLTLGSGEGGLRILLRDGQVAGLGPASAPPARPRLDDSAATRLERVLQEVGIRQAPPARAPVSPPAPSSGLRERVLDALVDSTLPTVFHEGAPGPPDVAEVAGATEPLILEAVRRLPGDGPVRALLGDLDHRLSATAWLAEERTLTLTEGYILSRIDGLSTARQVLQLVPLDPDETRRTLLGLLLTGRVESRPAPPTTAKRDAAPVIAPPPAVPAEPAPTEASEPGATARPESVGEGAGGPPGAEETALPTVGEGSPEGGPASGPAPAELDPETLARRREVLELFQSLPLKNHFEVLGVKPGCTDAEVRRAYVSLAKRFHPDARSDPRLADLQDVLEDVFIRVGEAWEVLGDAKSRASYEARFGAFGGPSGRAGAGPPSPGRMSAASDYAYVPPEETLLKAQLLIAQARYWDAIQMLEIAIPQMEPRRHQIRGRIFLARAYSKNPNWMRKAEEQLHEVVREDPTNVDAHYELGLLYKAGGLPARAQAMFRRVVELRPDHRDASAELGQREDSNGGGLFKRLFGRGKAS